MVRSHSALHHLDCWNLLQLLLQTMPILLRTSTASSHRFCGAADPMANLIGASVMTVVSALRAAHGQQLEQREVHKRVDLLPCCRSLPVSADDRLHEHEKDA